MILQIFSIGSCFFYEEWKDLKMVLVGKSFSRGKFQV